MPKLINNKDISTATGTYFALSFNEYPSYWNVCVIL